MSFIKLWAAKHGYKRQLRLQDAERFNAWRKNVQGARKSPPSGTLHGETRSYG